MGKNRNKLHYVVGECELEKGVVSFVGGMSGVSHSQVRYHVIYAIKDKFSEIDFWIDPVLSKCSTLPSTSNSLRYGVCSKFVCTYKPFEDGIVKPKLKLSDLDKRNYATARAKVDLGVSVFKEEIKVTTVAKEEVANSGYKVKSKVFIEDGSVQFMGGPDYTYIELVKITDIYIGSLNRI